MIKPETLTTSEYMNSPLAMMFSSVIATDEADRAIDFARLQAKASKAAMKRQAVQHAIDCIEACDAQKIYYDSDTLSANVESHFPDLSIDECDAAAITAIDSF